VKKRILSIATLMVLFSLNAFSQTTPINYEEREQERKRWNESLVTDTSYHFKKEVNSFLAEQIKKLKPGKALDVAMGQGRNLIYLAKNGWDATGFDIADEAIAFAQGEAKRQNVKIKTVLQGIEEFDFGNAQWDLISFIYAGCMTEYPDAIARMKKGLKPGGIIVFEFVHRKAGLAMDRPDFGCPTNAEKDALLKAGGFKIVSYEEKIGVSDYGLEKYDLVYLVAKRL
jgi:SAM-dependent methyltransferase